MAAAIHSPVAAGFTIRVNLRAAIVIAVTAIVVTARDPATPKLRRSRRRAL